MSILFKVIIIGIITVLLSALLKKYHPEYSIILVIVSSVIILVLLADSFTTVFDNINAILNDAKINPKYIETIVKIIGIAYLSEYMAALFYDANESAMAKKVELAGKIIIFLITLPVITSLSEMIISIL